MRGIACLLLLAGCGSGQPTRVAATINGDAGSYTSFDVCLDVTFQNKKTLATYDRGLCSDAPVKSAFAVQVSGAVDNPDTDVFAGDSDVYLANAVNGALVAKGTVSARSEKNDGDTADINVTVQFGATTSSGASSGGGGLGL